MKNSEIIIEDNRRVHDLEAVYYDKMHLEIFNFWEQRRINSQIRFILSQFPCKGNRRIKVLDAGCGTGNLTLKFMENGCTVTGIDVSGNMIEVLRKKLQDSGYTNFKLIVAEVGEILDRSEYGYDIICFSSIVHHLPDYKTVIEKTAGILNPGGILYITHEPFSCSGRKETLFFKIIKYTDHYFYYYPYLILHDLNSLHFEYQKTDVWSEQGLDLDWIISLLQKRGMELLYERKHNSTLKSGLLAMFVEMIGLYDIQFTAIFKKR